MSHIFNHLCLFLYCFLWHVCGSDLLSDSSGFTVLNVGVSKLHTNKQVSEILNLKTDSLKMLIYASSS